MRIALFLLVSAIMQTASAADGHGASVPLREVFWQVFNLTILFGGMIYFLRQPVKNFFAQRRTDFVDAANKSQAARLEAEKQFADIKNKLQLLESTRTESFARAEAEAADMRRQMIKDAEEIAQRVRHEAETTAQIEVQKARTELREAFVKEAVDAARTVLTKDIGSQDHQKLQNDFAQHLQGVNP